MRKMVWGNEWQGLFGTAADFGLDPARGRFAAKCDRHERFLQTSKRKEAHTQAMDTRLWCNPCRAELDLAQLPESEGA